MDVFLLILTIIFSLLLVVVNFYILARYAHQRDTSFGKSWFTKLMFVSAPPTAQPDICTDACLKPGARAAAGRVELPQQWRHAH